MAMGTSPDARSGVSCISKRGLNYARRQQYRRLARAGRLGLAGTAAAILGLLVVGVGAASLGLLLLAVALLLGLRARRWLSLAERSGVGARSEDEVRRALAPLEAEGWRMRHSLRWRGRGDIDSVAIGPTGIAVVIETKTRAYDRRHLALVEQQTAWLWRRRRRWCRSGVVAVLCLVRARGVEALRGRCGCGLDRSPEAGAARRRACAPALAESGPLSWPMSSGAMPRRSG